MLTFESGGTQFSPLHRPKRLRNGKLERRVKNSGGWVRKIQHLKRYELWNKRAEAKQRRIKSLIKKKLRQFSEL